jgi:hypothetical protein
MKKSLTALEVSGKDLKLNIMYKKGFLSSLMTLGRHSNTEQ